MRSCPYCSNPLLRQVSQDGIYWFCRNCWTDVPVDLDGDSTTLYTQPLLSDQEVLHHRD